MTKSRKCLSTTTLKSVENIKCVAAGKWDTEGFFKQEKDYKLKDCPGDLDDFVTMTPQWMVAGPGGKRGAPVPKTVCHHRGATLPLAHRLVPAS